MSSRNSQIEPLEVLGILPNTGQIAAAPTVSQHIACPSSPAPSAGSTGRHSFQSHSRNVSLTAEANVTAPPRSNRFSMSFPIQPLGSMSPVRTAHSPVREAHVIPDVTAPNTGPTDTNFFTAIAAQERRVLELKEDLSRAEADLDRLKRQWQQHEAQKKRNDAKSATKLQPLQTSLPLNDNESDSDGGNAWMQQEMERRKALLSGSKSSQRTVFSGSRHTRTLSLLSPVNRAPPSAPPNLRQPDRPPRKDSLSESVRRSKETEPPPHRPTPITRSSTTPDMSEDGIKATQSLDELAEAGIDKDIFLQTGKKVATGLRDGLWTFWEDLRQATVGEESTPIPPHVRHQSSNQTLRTAKKQSSKHVLRPSRGSTSSKTPAQTKKSSPARKHKKSATMSMGSTPALADPSFWSEYGISSQNPSPAPSKKRATTLQHSDSPSKAESVNSMENEAWDAWDEGSPPGSEPSSAASESTTVPSTASGATSPRRSTDITSLNHRQSTDETPTAKNHKGHTHSSVSNKDPIPWPALSTLGPKALRRTASHLMSEWEKSLTPSPTKESAEQRDYLGLGAEAAAASVSTDRRGD